MDRFYLEFEKPIEEINEQIIQTKEIGVKGQVDIKSTIKELETKLANTTKKIFKSLSPWQKVQISRHPDRPYTLDYINNILGNTFLELHGDRNFKDDKAMVGGLGKIDNQTFMFIGQQKGHNTKDRQYKQFMLPITFIVIIALYVGIFTAENPDGVVSVIFSMIPFTSPIVMMMRIPNGVPITEQIISLIILYLTVILIIWIAAKIYRIGILMYGKKPSYKDLIKWLKY